MATSTPVFPNLRKEVKDYIQSCEQLLSPLTFTAEAPLSGDERKMIELFMHELKTHLLTPQPVEYSESLHHEVVPTTTTAM